MTLLASDTITAEHRRRLAYVYVRQSTLTHVQQNQESRRNHYALVQRATAFGWSPGAVYVIASDLGQDSQQPGFQELVSAVSLGRVGIVLIIFAIEPSIYTTPLWPGWEVPDVTHGLCSCFWGS